MNRVNKNAPGNTTFVELGIGHRGGGFVDSDQDLIVADLNCSAIGQLSKADLGVAFTPITEASPLGGVTGIAVDASDVFCGHGPNIFVQPRSGGPVT